jgi:signal transduction histidine kinase/ligand-binding sensor domain-containing protein
VSRLSARLLRLLIPFIPRYSLILLVLVLWIVPFAGRARAERLPITAYGTADGLPGAWVTEVVRDSRGFIWFGTRDGLSRFDGVRFVNYGVEHGLADPTVNDVIESRTGGLWVGTNGGGMCHLAANAPPPERASRGGPPLFECVSPGDDGFAGRVNSLHEDRDGKIWVGTDGGLFRLDPLRRPYQFEHVTLPTHLSQPMVMNRNAGISQIIADGQGGLWIGSARGLVHRRGDGVIRAYPLPSAMTPERQPGPVTRLLVDRGNRLWIGLIGGLMVIRPATGAVSGGTGGTQAVREVTQPFDPYDPRGAITLQLPEAPGERLWIPMARAARLGLVRGLFAASDGSVWGGTTAGLLRIDIGDRTAAMRIYTTAHGLVSADIRGVAEDYDGNLWLASTGAMKLTRRGFITYTTADGLGDTAVNGIFETRAGVLTVVSGDWVLNTLDGDRFRSLQFRMPPRAVRPWGSQTAVLDRTNHWWLLSLPRLWRLPPFTTLNDLDRPLPSPLRPEDVSAGVTEPTFRLFESRTGDLWFGLFAYGRVVRWEKATGRKRLYTAADGLPIDLPTSFGEDARGEIWIGFRAGRVARLRNERFTVFAAEQQVPAGEITAIHADAAGRLWLGSSRGGLARVDDPSAATPTFQRYTTADGLGSNNIRGLVSDSDGRIYASTARGVDRIDPSAGHVRHYTTVDGLAPGLATSTYRDSHGRLWFGTTHGLSRLDPSSQPAAVPPPVWIGSLRIAGSPRYTSHLGERTIAPLTLEPNENQVSVEFFGLTFAMGESLRYQYRLEGADTEWTGPTPETSVHYSALAPGDYRFVVRAMSADGLVSTQAATIPFTVRPPLWQRTWFRLLILIAIGLAATLAYRLRVARLLELERVRTRIASDLHDDIGSNLSRMAILSEVAKRQIGDSAPEPARHLTEIAESARTLIDSMSDIVWSIDPRHDDLGSVIVRVRAFASEIFAASGVKWTCVAPPDLDRISLRPDARRHLLLLLKEGVTNIARHAQATHARLRVEVDGSQLTADLSDDGRGFTLGEEPPPAARGGHGRSSMRWRAAELGGTLRTISAPGAGTHITVTVPVRGPALRPAPAPSHAHAMPEPGDVRQDRG